MVSTSLEAGKIVNNFMCYIVTFLDSEESHNAVVRTINKIKTIKCRGNRCKNRSNSITRKPENQ